LLRQSGDLGRAAIGNTTARLTFDAGHDDRGRRLEEFDPVALLREAMLLHFVVGEDAKFHHRPLYLAIVPGACKLPRATALRGPLGLQGYDTLCINCITVS
jgi:hypothetical protein